MSNLPSNGINLNINVRFYIIMFLWLDGVPTSQNPTVAIESWINHNKVEREEFSVVLRENLKVTCSIIEVTHFNLI